MSIESLLIAMTIEKILNKLKLEMLNVPDRLEALIFKIKKKKINCMELKKILKINNTPIKT